MGIYETELGYQVRETLNGLDVYDNGMLVCVIDGKTLDDYRDEDENINDGVLEDEIKEEIEIEEFLAYQQEYC